MTLTTPADVKTGPESAAARALLISMLNTATHAPQKITAGETFKDPRLTTDALNDERKSQVAAAVNTLKSASVSTVNQIAELAVQATKNADQVRPSYDPNDANQVARIGQQWQFNILPILNEDGLPSWSALLDMLNLDGLFAVQNFGPTWIKTNAGPMTDVPGVTAAVLEGIQSRIPAQVTDSRALAALTNEQQTNTHLANAQALNSRLAAVKSSADATRANITTKQIAANMGATTELTNPPSNYRGY